MSSPFHGAAVFMVLLFREKKIAKRKGKTNKLAIWYEVLN